MRTHGQSPPSSPRVHRPGDPVPVRTAVSYALGHHCRAGPQGTRRPPLAQLLVLAQRLELGMSHPLLGHEKDSLS